MVVALTALCVALPQSVMAIDLSRLYGHLNAKRNGEFTINNLAPTSTISTIYYHHYHHQHQSSTSNTFK
jgi:hypothetical protein